MSTRSMETIYLSLSAQVAVGAFFTKSPVCSTLKNSFFCNYSSQIGTKAFSLQWYRCQLWSFYEHYADSQPVKMVTCISFYFILSFKSQIFRWYEHKQKKLEHCWHVVLFLFTTFYQGLRLVSGFCIFLRSMSKMSELRVPSNYLLVF